MDAEDMCWCIHPPRNMMRVFIAGGKGGFTWSTSRCGWVLREGSCS